NSLSRTIEEFKPLNPPRVAMYTCGPTVYQFSHIGNFRSFLTADILARTLRWSGYDLKFIINITDVGHMTDDQIGGADTGEDKIEGAAKREGKSVWEVAQFYTDAFLRDSKELNMIMPDTLARATDHIKEQITLIKNLQKKGFAYLIDDGVYFDTSKFPHYGQMSSLDQVREGATRLEANLQKRNPRDFALWKKSPQPPLNKGGVQDWGFSGRQMEWESPWGVGFPGWHVECSAMSMKYLGEQLDIHTGGIDHKEIHHPNEIAQSEGATGKKFVKYWVHTAFMLVSGQKMSKSLGNTYTLYDLQKEGYEPLALRYLYLQTHYRQEMNFIFPALDGASSALRKLRVEVAKMGEPVISTPPFGHPSRGESAVFERRFAEAVNDDLNMAKALSVLWELIKSDVKPGAKAASIFKMDEILGLDLRRGAAVVSTERQVVPDVVKELLKQRRALRSERRFSQADQVRKKIGDLGYEIEDTDKGTRVRKK
ncbi:MAG: cysteine--tRNA ligase, partial [Candidatus Margulisiibacteriota bacterium]